MLRSLRFSLVGCALCIAMACANTPQHRWHSLATTSPITWTKTTSLSQDGASQVHMQVEGTGSKSTAPAISFEGTSELPAGTILYAFFTKDANDSTVVENFLRSGVSLQNWRAARGDSVWGGLFKVRENFLEVPVLEHGKVFFFLDELRSPACSQFRQLTLVDQTRAILDRLATGG